MKSYTQAIGYVVITVFLTLIVVGYFLFYTMYSSLATQYEEQFNIASESKINIFKERVDFYSERFKSYAQLPSFKTMRFHSLTLNDLAVEESKRHLELFFFDMIKNNHYIERIRFLDNDGAEIINVDHNTIHYNLSNITFFKNVAHVLTQDLKPDEIHMDIIRDDFGVFESLVWWLPVYVSSTQRMGYLAFNVSASLLHKEIIDISDPGLNYVVITRGNDDFLKDDYQLISEPLPDNIKLQDNLWIVSEPLEMEGLNLEMRIIGDADLYTKGISTILFGINFVLVPVSVVILILLLYMFRKKIDSDNKIHHLAYYDSLTGLVNRHQFDNALNVALSDTHKHHSHHALLYLDLDQFKVVNDTCGHLAGDKLLEELAIHLKHFIRESDMFARLGGDEFALLLNSCPEEKAIAIANKILSAVSDFHFVWEDRSFTVGVSIGVVYITDPDETASNVLRKSDLACYMAKELGRNRIHVYTGDDQSLEERHGEMQWVSRIHQAIAGDLFFLVAQRILPLDNDSEPVKRYEVLIRLNENNSTIPPGAFIPAAERYGIMSNIDKWVVDKTFSFMKRLYSSPLEENKNTVFSINLSGLSLGEKDFFKFIQDKFLEYKIPPENICFEITETAAISNLSVALDFMNSVKALGCNLALDDFGSGLCSFSYLKSIPVDYLKIDGSFVTRMLDDPLNMAIVMAIKQISLATNTKVIAEFVVNDEIKQKLQEMGVNYAQGYGIEKPVMINHLIKLADINSINQSAS